LIFIFKTIKHVHDLINMFNDEKCNKLNFNWNEK